MFLTAPVILIPENIYAPSKPMIVVDTGSITLSSKLASYNSNINYKEEQSAQLLYDRYEVLLQNF